MQTASDGVTRARRTLDIEDYFDIVRRHRRWIAGPALAGVVVAVVAACLWPNTYVSEAIIRVQIPLVSEKYIPSNSNMDLTDRINAMIPSVFKNDRLETIIRQTGIYKKELTREPMLDIITRMQSHIDIGKVISIQASGGRAPVPAFRVSFEYPDRRLARDVVARLVSAFIYEDTQTRHDRSSKTTGFLSSQAEASKQELDGIESRLASFRANNTGRLPEQMQANLQTLNSLQTQLATVNDAISRLDQDSMLLRSTLNIYQDQLDSLQTPAEQLSSAVKSERVTQTERDILQLETTLAALRERYTESHPDVRSVESQLASLKATRDRLMKQEAKPEPRRTAPPVAGTTEARATQQLRMNINAINAQIKAKDMEKGERQAERKRLNASIQSYNARIEASPGLEQEYAKLTRDYSLAKSRYEDLSAKKSLSEAAADLDSQESGEMLEILQDPTMPQTPSKPNRPIIIAVGAAFGLVLGLFTAAGREIKDSSLKNLKDARVYTGLPVLGTIPLLENDLVVRRKRRLVWLGWSVACLLAIAAMSASFVYYYTKTSM